MCDRMKGGDSMKKILVIGCPGSGKSTFSLKLAKKYSYDVLHLDYIYHIDNERQISKQELREKIKSFVDQRDAFIIDGNYTSTLAFRMQYADTIFLLDIDTEICLKNAVNRLTEPRRPDMAPGFDHTKMDDDFLEYIRTFNDTLLPKIRNILRDFRGRIVVIHSYEEMDVYL